MSAMLRPELAGPFERSAEALGLRNDATYGATSLRALLVTIYGYAADILRDQDLEDYTDHGISHSERILGRVLELVAALRLPDLSQLERFVLGSAALIHDIGMQHNRYKGTEARLGDDLVRKTHCELGERMWADSFSEEGRCVRELPSYLAIPAKDRMLTDWIRDVAFAHQRSAVEQWNRLLQYKPAAEHSKQLLRMPLLGCLLRMGDELDCDWNRIAARAERLYGMTLADESRCHWLTCCYIPSLAMPTGGGYLHVDLALQMPKVAESDRDVYDAIRLLVGKYRVDSIHEEYQGLKKVFESYLSTPSLTLKCTMDDPTYADSILQPSSTVLEYLWTKYPSLRHATLQTNGLRWLEGSSSWPLTATVGEPASPRASAYDYDYDGVKRLAPTELAAFAASYAEEYFSRDEHVELPAPVHTDRYLDCRELIARREFRTALATALVDYYGNAGITDVVSLGGGATMLSAHVCSYLGARLWPVEAKYGSPGTTIPQSVLPRTGGPVLIVDDIIGAGSVAGPVARALRESVANRHLMLFSLYAFGPRVSALGTLRGLAVETTVLCVRPDVLYYPVGSDGKCDKCRADPSIVVHRYDD